MAVKNSVNGIGSVGIALRHDNGLVFSSGGHIASARDYGLTEEYITPYTPQENGLYERFIRTTAS